MESEPLKTEIKKDKLEIMKDKLPENVKFSMDPLSRDLENICANIYVIVKDFFNKPDNALEYGLLVVKVMESVENIKGLSGDDKYKVATRCIIELIKETDKIPDDVKNDLIITVPGSIKAVIQLTKGEPINRNIKGLNVVESAYVTKRSIERIIEYIRKQEYDIAGILENIFMIVTQIMYIVGSYPSLSGSQKKDIVVKVITHVITEYTENNTGDTIPDEFVKSVLDSLPSIIDTLANVSKGLFNINKIKKYCTSCFSCIC